VRTRASVVTTIAVAAALVTAPTAAGSGDHGGAVEGPRAVHGVGDRGGVYVLDAHSPRATFVLRLSLALEGTSSGVDSNSAANALRVVSDTGQDPRRPSP